jgi:7-carboxy-7-deazaguanine synthase
MCSIKEAFYSLQGEGTHAGRPALFCRFTGCNLWSGREKHRSDAQCQFCDTDFVGTNGSNGGKFKSPEAVISHLEALWQQGAQHKYLIFTGGEPALQLDDALIQAAKAADYTIAVEINDKQMGWRILLWSSGMFNDLKLNISLRCTLQQNPVVLSFKRQRPSTFV